jgi:hypothetical protein
MKYTHKNEALFELSCLIIRQRHEILMISALTVLRNFFKNNKLQLLLEQYWDSNVHETITELMMDNNPEVANLSISIFGVLVSEDKPLTEVS